MAIGNQQPVLGTAADQESGRPLDSAGAERLRRRADLLLSCAHALHCQLDIHAVVTSLASRVQELLEVDVVVLLRRRGDHFVLEALAATDPALNNSVHSEFLRGNIGFVGDIAARAELAGEPIGVSIGAYDAAATLFPAPGQLLAAPLRSPEANGALVTYRAGVRPFDREERSALAALCSLGALAIANAELYARADSRGRELQQLLEITSELGGIGNLQDFLDRFVVRAAEFLGFERSFIAVAEDDICEIQCLCERGVTRPFRQPLPASLALRVQGSSDPFWSNDILQWPGVELVGFAGHDTRQVLCVPLSGPDGALLGVLGLLDRADASDISAEDVRRARSLAAEVSVALQAARGLHASTEHRRRSEILMGLALELNSRLRLSDFGESFTRRAVDTFGCHAAALCVAVDKRLELVDLYDRSRDYDAATRYSLAAMVSESVKANPAAVVCGAATELLGGSVASLGWNNIVIARMNAPDGSFIGCLLLTDPPAPLSSDDRKLLDALVAHAAVALDNARLFTRMDQANRHWMEIFDAITDLIVVHDENLKVLRVNRSLADFIGVSPNELIGVSMRAMIAMAADHGAEACPFCRVVSGGDEYIHPVLDRTYLVSTSRVHGGGDTPGHGAWPMT
ncbi:MAG: GAF domain-containing protein, partial [Stenotrophobium sp.]